MAARQRARLRRRPERIVSVDNSASSTTLATIVLLFTGYPVIEGATLMLDPVRLIGNPFPATPSSSATLPLFAGCSWSTVLRSRVGASLGVPRSALLVSCIVPSCKISPCLRAYHGQDPLLLWSALQSVFQVPCCHQFSYFFFLTTQVLLSSLSHVI
jgi:hypothetical protein